MNKQTKRRSQIKKERPVSKGRRQFDYAWIGASILVATGLLTTGILQRLLEDAPVIATFVLLFLFGLAWFAGSREGAEMESHAKKVRTEAMTRQERADQLSRMTQEETQSLHRQRQAFEAMEQAAEIKNRGDDLRFIDMSYELPLEKRIEVSMRVGAYPSESLDTYQRRRQELIDRRAQEWRAAKRFGQLLLPLVEEQRGLCGNPKKDLSRKGCGAYLYSFPMKAVHIDHIKPQSRGGSDNPANLQALCSYCNTSAGNRA